MKAERGSSSQPSVEAGGNASGPVEARSSRDDTLSFLNNLPQVNKPKPKPKRSILDEHLDFLNSLPKTVAQPVSTPPVSEQSAPPPENTHPVRSAAAVLGMNSNNASAQNQPSQKKVSRKVKKKTQQQLMKEEKNRLEKERAEAKRREIEKRHQEAAEREERIAREEEQKRARQEAILEAQAKAKPQKQSIFGKLIGA